MSAENPTRPVRPGEALDTAWLERFLLDRVAGLACSRGPLEVTQFPSGHSNLTYALRLGDRELVLRRPPFGAKAILKGHDMSREFRLLTALPPEVGAPKPVAFCPEAESPLGADFYVMERVPGLILRGTPPDGLDLGPSRMRALSEAFVERLARLHGLDLDATGLRDFGKPEGYLARQVKGWTERYAKAKTDEIPDVEQVAAWLDRHLPPEQPPALIHNDFKYDNLVLDPSTLEIRAVLDWEMATVGDPLSDLGMALAYWVTANDPEPLRALKLGLTVLPGNLTRDELVARWAQKTARDVTHVAWHYVLSLFKVAVIAQQIYARYAKGLTKDERFGALIQGVRVLGARAAEAIERGNVT